MSWAFLVFWYSGIDFAYRSLISVVGFEFTLCEIFYFFQYFSTSTTGSMILLVYFIVFNVNRSMHFYGHTMYKVVYY